jgi:hypothetical protein
MEPTRKDRASGEDTVTAYEYAMNEVEATSSKLARELSRNDPATVERECSAALRIYEDMILLFPRACRDATQRASLWKALELLKSRLEACDEAKSGQLGGQRFRG